MELKEARKEIDELDLKIFALLEERMKMVDTVVSYKESNGVAIRDVRREKKVLDRINEYVAPEYAYWIRDIYKSVILVSRTYQKSKIHVK